MLDLSGLLSRPLNERAAALARHFPGCAGMDGAGQVVIRELPASLTIRR